MLGGMKNLAFEAVCKYFGSQRKLAAVLGVTPAAIGHVANGRRPIPAEWCPIIEEATRGLYLCEFLRPDMKWSVVRRSTPDAQTKASHAVAL